MAQVGNDDSEYKDELDYNTMKKQIAHHVNDVCFCIFCRLESDGCWY